MIGQSIGSYRIAAKLGEGGMGVVYLGEHQRIDRKAAIKVLLPELSANEQVVARFFNEARATSQIRHPGIVEIADCDVLPSGSAYIVMELLEGESLGGFLRRGQPMPAGRALSLTRHIADALAAAHEKRIVHRDLKPDNVFLLASATASPIKILDFGIAKLMHTEPGLGRHRTGTGHLLGTPVYMSPEQCRGAGQIDHRTDIYSLGCILFEMLSGRPPFTYEGVGELIHAHFAETPPTLKSLGLPFSAAIDGLVARMLEKSPADRPQTMRALMTELDAVIAGEPAMTEAPETRPAAAAPIPIAQTQTTLRSASSEKFTIAEADPSRAIAKTRGAKRAFIAAAAIAVVASGILFWRLKTRVEGGPVATGAGDSSPMVSPAALAPTVPQTPPPAPPSPAPAPAPAAPPSPTPTAVPAPAAPPLDTKPSPAPAPRTVKVAIASEPSGADVCLQQDRVLLGRTSFEWRAEKGSRRAKLLVRKRGYRGQEITVSLDRDSRKLVTLDRLGRDDIDDMTNCISR